MTMLFDREKIRGRLRGEGGFTLIEILVVITIIALIMSLVGPRVLNYLGELKVKAAKIQIQSFGSALDLFNLDTGRYPTTGRRIDGAGAIPRNDCVMERPLPERRRGAERPVGKALCLSFARGARSL